MQGEWIWTDNVSDDDTYAEFQAVFECEDKNVVLEISADSEYAVFLNERFVYSGQYADFPWYKIYDEIDLREYVKKGKNLLTVCVWYSGGENSCHYKNRAGVCFSVRENNNILVNSSKATQSRRLPYFISGNKKIMTPQIGFTFGVDFTAAAEDFSSSVVLENMPNTLFKRPIKLLNRLDKRSARRLNEGVYDLDEETVGLPYIELDASYGELLTIVFGERLNEDGHVPRIIGERDFSYTIIANGETIKMFNPFRKLGCRYFEVIGKCSVNDIGLIPLEYPFELKEHGFVDERRKSIYEVALRTLKLNAFEHYFDCPWREQAFYALDGYFQMRYGYSAFKNTEFQRGALKLMSEDRNKHGLVSITVPTASRLTIPSFSLYYVIAMYEYAAKTGDHSLIEEYFNKLVGITDCFLKKEKDGLIQNFTEDDIWNFYEWNDCLDGWTTQYKEDCALNLNMLLELQSMVEICGFLGKDCSLYRNAIDRIRDAINKKFWVEEKGLYKLSSDDEVYTELVNSYAVLSGAASGERAAGICEKLIRDGCMIKCTLSMLSCKYDALLKCDMEGYKQYVLNDIDEKYEYMLSFGATSFWETLKGWRDFDEAGSLCHGWSALPVYYYAVLS